MSFGGLLSRHIILQKDKIGNLNFRSIMMHQKYKHYATILLEIIIIACITDFKSISMTLFTYCLYDPHLLISQTFISQN